MLDLQRERLDFPLPRKLVTRLPWLAHLKSYLADLEHIADTKVRLRKTRDREILTKASRLYFDAEFIFPKSRVLRRIDIDRLIDPPVLFRIRTAIAFETV